MDCTICCEKFNKSTRFQVECKSCEESVCRQCYKTFILEHSQQEPGCMFCKVPFDRDFMNTSLTKKFVDTSIKKHVENVYLEQEMSKLPETQQAAKTEKRVRDLMVELDKATKILSDLKKQYREQQDIVRAYQLNILRERQGNTVSEIPENNFTHKCSLPDCNGFLDDKYICGLCDTQFCKKCLEIKNENHECDKELLATIQAIKKEAKPCPSCGEMISKIDGCDQMWCIKCHVQFSWRTGTQLNGYNHNPEYFRWLRETGQNINRNPQDIAPPMICGEVFNERNLITIIRNFSPRDDSILTICLFILRYYRHNEYELERYNYETIANNQLQRLRIQYLLKDISKDTWKEEIQKVKKNLNKQKGYTNIRTLINSGLHSIIERMYQYKNENNIIIEYKNLITEADLFKKYINTCFLRISTTYGSTTCPGINSQWRELKNLKMAIKKGHV